MYTASAALLDALEEAGVSCVFANFGSDHPALVEAIAEAKAHGRKIPRFITCPYEMVGLSAAQGYAQVSGEAQAVLVHVDCGTQALGGAVHNAARARIPVLILAGLSPATQEGEVPGGRNEFIHWLQDVPDQRGIIRQYVKYDNEIRQAANTKQIVHRALQIATSDPRGPVHLVAAREVLGAEVMPVPIDREEWSPVAAAPLPESAVDMLIDALTKAHRPLIVTSYLGRKPQAVEELTRFCNRLGVGVLESAPGYLNYPHHDTLYQGNHWNQPYQNPALAEADVVLVIDSDIPWVPAVNRPGRAATVFHIDVDPLKPTMPLWYIKARATFAADSSVVLGQLNARLDGVAIDGDAVRRRRDHYGRRHAERSVRLATAESRGDGSSISPEYLTACIRAQIDDETLVLNEGITNYHAILDHIGRSRPGTMLTSGGSSLGWSGGAAIGAKLAAPNRTVVSLTGDGSYMFSVPSTVHWMARRYETPFLQVVYNNGGWNAPRFSALAVHPDGHASRSTDLGFGFDPPPDYAAIAAAAGGAFARKVERAQDLEDAIAGGLRAVREEGRAAVLDVSVTRH